MTKFIFTALFLIGSLLLISCGAYSFTGGSTGDAKTLQIDFFPNQAPLVEPSLSQAFTTDLLDLFTRQTNLTTVTSNGDLYFSGEITGYRVTPMSATANQTAAQNRLTVTVNVRFVNKLIEKDDFEKQFSFYSDFAANAQLTGGVLESALDEILERITQDIFNASVAKW
ncbi:LptE family protein [uncultured Polaribacter sp.]|uniref:LptE family protein n=1 Tax=uncultured Polaribacter sp. TaxID=174711 RepID=UPI002604430C|nr:LptE family protein [uncultured Polaribacter sp.]